MAQRFLSIKNFEKYQKTKSKEGSRPWVKLWKSILNDPEFMNLTPEYRYIYIMLILLADDTQNKIYADSTYLRQRLYITHTKGIRGEYIGSTHLDLKPLYRSGFLNTSNLSRVLSEAEAEAEAETETDFAMPPAQARETPSPAQLVWASYSEAYKKRYQAAPIRNAMVNGQITNLLKRLPKSDAPYVAAFYVWHNDQFFVRNRHPLGLLLKGCEGLHTQWKTGQSITSAQARKVDETQGRLSVFQELINEREREAQVVHVETA